MDYIGINNVDKSRMVLERKEEFPIRTKIKIIELVEAFINKLLGYCKTNGDVDINKALIFYVESNYDNNNHNALKVITILKNTNSFNLRTRYNIDVLAEEFLRKAKDDIHDMIIENNLQSNRGLDSSRDTEEEVETAIRFFPDVLSRVKQEIVGDEDSARSYYPIQYCAYTYNGPNPDLSDERSNFRAVSFIPVLARLAIEFGVLFDGKEERGGLLCHDCDGGTVFQNLMKCYKIDSHTHEAVDDKYLQVLIQLRRMGLMKKEDIQEYFMLLPLCDQYDDGCHYHYAEKRFKFLVEWEPSALIQPISGSLPIHDVAQNSTIRGFQHVFEYGIRYYPKKIGINLLFRKCDRNYNGFFWGHTFTSFQLACRQYEKDGGKKVLKIVKEILAKCYASSSDTTPSLNVVEALIMAAIDKNIHLDCVYFLIREHPDILSPLPPPSSSSTSSQA